MSQCCDSPVAVAEQTKRTSLRLAGKPKPVFFPASKPRAKETRKRKSPSASGKENAEVLVQTKKSKNSEGDTMIQHHNDSDAFFDSGLPQGSMLSDESFTMKRPRTIRNDINTRRILSPTKDARSGLQIFPPPSGYRALLSSPFRQGGDTEASAMLPSTPYTFIPIPTTSTFKGLSTQAIIQQDVEMSEEDELENEVDELENDQETDPVARERGNTMFIDRSIHEHPRSSEEPPDQHSNNAVSYARDRRPAPTPTDHTRTPDGATGSKINADSQTVEDSGCTSTSTRGVPISTGSKSPWQGSPRCSPRRFEKTLVADFLNGERTVDDFDADELKAIARILKTRQEEGGRKAAQSRPRGEPRTEAQNRLDGLDNPQCDNASTRVWFITQEESCSVSMAAARTGSSQFGHIRPMEETESPVISPRGKKKPNRSLNASPKAKGRKAVVAKNAAAKAKAAKAAKKANTTKAKAKSKASAKKVTSPAKKTNTMSDQSGRVKGRTPGAKHACQPAPEHSKEVVDIVSTHFRKNNVKRPPHPQPVSQPLPRQQAHIPGPVRALTQPPAELPGLVRAQHHDVNARSVLLSEMPQSQQASTAPPRPTIIPNFDDPLTSFHDEARKRKKTRKGQRKTVKTRDGSQKEGEIFNINEGEDGEEEEEEEDGDGPRAHQKRFYKGENKRLIETATNKFKIYLLNVNAFPDAEALSEWTEKSFVAAAMDMFGARYKALMPPFSIGIRKLLANETWSTRGRIKRSIVKWIDRYYRIHPEPGAFDHYPNPTEQEKRYVRHRVEELMDESAFLQGAIVSGGPAVAFGHPAIREFIHILVFCKKSSRTPLGSVDLDAFNPIPLPLMAYACTALLHGLEQYQDGTLNCLEFSSAEYSDYYSYILDNLRGMAEEPDQKDLLDDIRRRIYETGCTCLHGINKAVHGRPIGPFKPSSSTGSHQDVSRPQLVFSHQKDYEAETNSPNGADEESSDLDDSKRYGQNGDESGCESDFEGFACTDVDGSGSSEEEGSSSEEEGGGSEEDDAPR